MPYPDVLPPGRHSHVCAEHERVMPLSGLFFRRLEVALCSAFPTRAAFQRLLRFRMDLRAAEISDANNLREIVFDVLEWVEAQGRLAELVDQAMQEVPGNAALRDAGTEYLESLKGGGPAPMRGEIVLPGDVAPAGRMERGDPFFEQVGEICRLREGPGVVLSRTGAPAPLGVVWQVRTAVFGVPRGYALAAVERGLSAEHSEAFLQLHAEVRQQFAGAISVLVSREAPPPELVAQTQAEGAALVSYRQYLDLIDFTEYLHRQTEWLSRNPDYQPRFYVPQRLRIRRGEGWVDGAERALDQLVAWMTAPEGRFVLVLGEFGHGKTFLLRELARRLTAGVTPEAPVPVFLELRRLEKTLDLDALIGAHLGRNGMGSTTITAFRYMLEAGRIALLCDGFDELAMQTTYERAADHFATLTQAARGHARVVASSRTAHFLNERQALTALGRAAAQTAHSELLELTGFDRVEARAFLVNYLGSEAAAHERQALMDAIRDLPELSENPRMLSFIAGLPAERLQEAARREGILTAADVYEQLVDAWFAYEDRRAREGSAPRVIEAPLRWQMVTELALHLWRQDLKRVSLQGLKAEVRRVLARMEAADLDADVAVHHGGSATLLARSAAGEFGFRHQSVQDYLVGRHLAHVFQEGDRSLLAGRQLTPLVAEFFWGTAGREPVVRWARGVLHDPAAGAIVKQNAQLVLRRMEVSETAGAQLAGRDLRGSDFSGQDLTGADLRGADLRGVNLAGAVLRGADLTDARVADADLRGADLTGADLTRADLTRTTLIAACLHRAVLKDTALWRARTFAVKDLPAAAGGVAPVLEAQAPGPGGAPVKCVAVHPRGDLLAAGYNDGSLVLWDLETGQPVRRLTGHGSSVDRCSSGNEGVHSVAWGGDGARLASGGDDGTVRVWDVAAGCELHRLKAPGSKVWSVAWAGDGERLASGESDRTVRVWDAATGRELHCLEGHWSKVLSVAWAGEGVRLASGGDDGTVRVWDAAAGCELHRLAVPGSKVRSVAWARDGVRLARGGDDATVRVWDAATGCELHRLEGHNRRVQSVAWVGDGVRLASGGGDATVRVWNAAAGREVHRLAGHPNWVGSVAWAGDGVRLASGGGDGTVRVWDTAAGCELHRLVVPGSKVWSVAWTGDGERLAGGGWDHTVRVWDAASGRELDRLEGHDDVARSVTWAGDGVRLASGGHGGTVRVWDTAAGRELHRLEGHGPGILSVAWAGDGEWLASGGADATVRVWDTAAGQELHCLEDHRDWVRSVAWAGDGVRLASGGDDATVRVWDAATGLELHRLEVQGSWVLSVAWAGDGERLASGGPDGRVRVWDTATGRELHRLEGHGGSVLSVAFSPDGRRLVSTGTEGVLRLWDAETGVCLALLIPLPEGWAAATPDGKHYKYGGNPRGFWHAAGVVRYEPGELDDLIPGFRLAEEAPLPLS